MLTALIFHLFLYSQHLIFNCADAEGWTKLDQVAENEKSAHVLHFQEAADARSALIDNF